MILWKPKDIILLCSYRGYGALDAPSRVAKYAKIHEMEFLYYIGESCPGNIVVFKTIRGDL
jgi:hypothetical protein